MTKKEEAEAKRAAKLDAEKARIEEMKSFERNHSDCMVICGVDEAGRGPFAGPVIAGAVVLDIDDPEMEILYLNDSKKLSEKKREMLYREILLKAKAVGIGYAGAGTIDKINILQATLLAMKNAIGNLTNVKALVGEDDDTHTLVNKLIKYELPGSSTGDVMGKADEERLLSVPDFILADAIKKIPGVDIPTEGIVKGDAKSVNIAAGSIIAKVTRDHIMYEYDKIYPQYGFASHKGYGTAQHIKAIKEFGLTDIHRRSFIHI